MKRSGYKARIYLGTAVVPGVQDITVAMSRTEIQVKQREKRTVGYLKGLIDFPIDFDMLRDEENATFLAFKNAFFSEADDDYITLDITDRAKTSSEWTGIRADFVVTKFEEGFPIDDVAMQSVSIRLAANSPNEILDIDQDTDA
ncbi:MAG: hypothetical protein LBQ54_00930 [Planctomycetaceae bacterium]|jgi:hypothetical protein|nr:hypothetical protein [Planctomycetaceae bacterium]